MEPTTRLPETSDRLRLVDVRFSAGESSLHFGGGLAGVLTSSSERSAAAHRIVTTVMGPRPAEADASVDIDGHLVSVHTLPSILLPPSAPAVLARDDLSAHWRALCARRRNQLAASHASGRLEHHRIEAALDRARGRVPGVGAVEPDAPDMGASNASETARLASQAIRLRAHVHTLLESIEALVPVPSSEAMALADDWDAHTALVLARNKPNLDVDSAARRLQAARMAVATSAGGMSGATLAEIDRRHRVVVEAEAQLFETRRKGRAEAVARYERAVEAEKVALGDAGVGSYASFLVAMAGAGKPLDPERRRIAQQELAAAQAEFDLVQQVVGLSAEEVQARAIELRAHAERLLGRVVVGGDPPAELRALRLDAPGRAERVRELAEVLRAADVDVRHDAVASARELLVSDLPDLLPRRNTMPVDPTRAARSDEIDRLEQQHEQNVRMLAELAAEIARLDEIHDSDISDIAPADVAGVMESLLDAYRAGNLLSGRLPVVLDGALDSLAPQARGAAVVVLAQAADVQSIVVTDDLEVMKNVTDAGGTIVLWPEPAESRDDAELHASPRSGT